MCALCLRKAASENRDSYRAKRLGGTCPCGEPSRKSRALCDGCREKQSARESSVVNGRVAAALCVKCGRVPNDGETKKCAPCREKHRAISLRTHYRRRGA